MPDLHLDPEKLLQFAKKLAPYDPVDLLTAIGGLQLVPENADRAIRLEVFAHVAASLEDHEPNRPHISSNRLSHFCHTEPLGQGWIASQEDPFENPFLEAFTFHGGNFLVFPGRTDESTFVLRLLCEALFAKPDTFSDPHFVREAHALLSATLVLSNEMAQRAGLVRETELLSRSEGHAVSIPDTRTLAALKHAVCFHQSELIHLLGDHPTSSTALDQMTYPLGRLSLADYDLDTGLLQSHPIICAGDNAIVALPGMLLIAVRHALIRLAIERGMEHALAMRYHEVVWKNLVESLDTLCHQCYSHQPPELPTIPCCQDAFFSLDSDKIMHTLLITDPLTGYDANNPFHEWSLQSLESQVEARLQCVQKYLSSLNPSPSEIFFLIVLQGVGRPGRWHTKRSDNFVFPPLSMSAGDVQTIAGIEKGDQLTLWKYAKASWKVREQTIVQVFSQLDEFSAYREYGYTYYPSDKERPDYISILPGGAGELRREVARQQDRHGVTAYYRPAEIPRHIWYTEQHERETHPDPKTKPNLNRDHPC